MSRTDKIVLNNQQRSAVTHKSGPLLIIAGAGTGKTTVITERIKYLIQKKHTAPDNIFAATFTDKAAAEMLNRLDVALPLGYEQPWLGTFHGLCDRLLKSEGLAIGIDPNYKIITPVDQWILIKQHLFDFNLSYYRPLGNPTKFIDAILKFFSRCQDEDVDAATLSTYAATQKSRAADEAAHEEADKLLELAGAYKKYSAIKIEQSALDFGDLITQTLHLFRTRKSVLKKYRQQFTHFLIDEFQDTNFAQYQLIKLLAPASAHPNLIVVGDDDQSIYKFRGAAISNILSFQQDYPKSGKIVLTKNYRSVKRILDAAYKLIQHNNPDRLEVKLNIKKKLVSANAKKPLTPPLTVEAATNEMEVDYTIKTILELVAKENYSYKDFAILTRSNSQLDPYVTGLKRAGLPYQRLNNRGLFDQPEITDLIHFLRVIANPQDSTSLFHFLHLRPLNFSPSDTIDLLNQARRQSTSLWFVLSTQTSQLAQQAVELITTYQQQSLNQSVTKLLHQFIIDTGYINTFLDEESLSNQLKIKNINLFFDRVTQYETNTHPAHVTDFVDTLNIWQEAGDSPAQAVIEDVDTISLLTVHSAKGLEFPVVFIGSLVAGRFPSINRRDPIEFPEGLVAEVLPQGNAFIEEERRLLYVAVTRAKDYLYLTYAKNYGGVRDRKPSGFLAEIDLTQVNPDISGALSLTNAQSNNQPPTARYLTKAGEFDISYISHSQIDTFEACPLKYKYRYLLRVPAEPHHALSFGQTIHQTLYQFHLSEKQGKILTQKELLKLYKDNFIELGYESEAHKQERFQAGKTALIRYHQLFPSLFSTPQSLEKSFRLSIAGIPLKGKIDRIDQVGDEYEIIDYKTGQPKDKKAVKRDHQLTIYGLAANEALKINATKLSLYFIETNTKVTTTRTSADYQKEKQRLKAITKKIKSSDFKPKPGYPFPCKFCEYKNICPYAKKA